MKFQSKTIYYVLAPIVILLWSSTFASTKVLLRSFSPEVIMLFRFVIAWIALMIAHPHLHVPRSWREEGMFVLASFTGCILYFWTENTALEYANTVTVGLLVAVTPLLTMWIAKLLDRSIRVRWTHWVGSVISLLGVVLLSFNGEVALSGNVWGYILSLLAALSWAFYTNILKFIGRHNDSVLYTTRRVYFYAILFLVVYFIVIGQPIAWSALLEPLNFFNVIYLGVFASCLSFVFWALIIRRLGILVANNYLYLSPLFVVMLGAVFLNEVITVWIAGGALLVVAGLIVGDRKG